MALRNMGPKSNLIPSALILCESSWSVIWKLELHFSRKSSSNFSCTTLFNSPYTSRTSAATTFFRWQASFMNSVKQKRASYVPVPFLQPKWVHKMLMVWRVPSMKNPKTTLTYSITTIRLGYIFIWASFSVYSPK